VKPAILFLDHAPIIGGAEKSLQSLMRGLRARGFPSHLAAPPGPYADQARREDIQVHEVDFPRLRRSLQSPVNLLATAKKLSGICLEAGAGLIYANTVRAAFYGAPASRLAHVPFIWHMRDFSLSENPRAGGRGDRLGKSILCRAAALVLANSHAVGSGLPCHSKVRVVHNGIDPGHFKAANRGETFRETMGIPAQAPVIGMAGRLRPWKGQIRFLHAMARLAETDPDLYILIAGGPGAEFQDGYETRLREIAGRPPLRGRVVFAGHQEDIRPALEAMTVFVHPGDPEPFGLVNIEAMALGKPVVAFAHGALPEIVDHNQTGLLVQPLDEVGLANAVRQLLEAPERVETMGRAGRERVQSYFTVDRVVQEVAQAIEAILR